MPRLWQRLLENVHARFSREQRVRPETAHGQHHAGHAASPVVEDRLGLQTSTVGPRPVHRDDHREETRRRPLLRLGVLHTLDQDEGVERPRLDDVGDGRLEHQQPLRQPPDVLAREAGTTGTGPASQLVEQPDRRRDTGLDPITADAINDLIVEMTKELGCAAVSITHDMASARKIADEIAMLHGGKIVWRGPTASLDSSGNAMVEQFVAGRADGPIQAVV